MKTWTAILSSSLSPDEKLDELFELWDDIMHIYDEAPIMTFRSVDYMAIPNGDYRRSYYPMNTTSIIRLLPTDTMTMKLSTTEDLLREDSNNLRLITSWANIFNRSLTTEQRNIIVRRYFYHESYKKICRLSMLEKSHYYRLLKKARSILINEYGLNVYDKQF